MTLPEWLVGEKYITLATWGLVFCTFLLVIATLIVWADSWKRGKEQRERWAREDARAKQSREPKYDFGLKLTTRPQTGDSYRDLTTQGRARLWVVNFGLYGLYVNKLFVKHREFDVAELEINKMVPAGGQLDFELPSDFWEHVPSVGKPNGKNYIHGDHEIWLSVSDVDTIFESRRILYWVLYIDGRFNELKRGSFEQRQPNCPKCGQMLNALLPPTGLLTEREVQEAQWRHLMEDLASTCPNHKSVRLEWIPTPDWVGQVMTNYVSKASISPSQV